MGFLPHPCAACTPIRLASGPSPGWGVSGVSYPVPTYPYLLRRSGACPEWLKRPIIALSVHLWHLQLTV